MGAVPCNWMVWTGIGQIALAVLVLFVSIFGPDAS